MLARRQSARVLGAILFLLLMLWMPLRSAQACGAWFLTDEEAQHRVRFYIHSVSTQRGEEDAVRVFFIAGDAAHELYLEDHGRRLIDIQGETLRLSGRPVGRVSGDSVTIRDRTYQISVQPNPVAQKNPHHLESAWLVEVRREGSVIARGDAMALCLAARRDAPPEEQQLEIRRRTLYYLAWRDLVRKKPPAQRPR